MPNLEVQPVPAEPTDVGRVSHEIRRVRDAGEGLSMSVGDRGGWVVRDPESLDLLLALVERLESITEIQGRLRDLDDGKPGLSLDQARDHVRAKYGLSV